MARSFTMCAAPIRRITLRPKAPTGASVPVIIVPDSNSIPMTTSRFTLDIETYDEELQPSRIYHSKKYIEHKDDLLKLIQSCLPASIKVSPQNAVLGYTQITVSITYEKDAIVMYENQEDPVRLFSVKSTPVYVKLVPVYSSSYETRAPLPFPNPCACC